MTKNQDTSKSEIQVRLENLAYKRTIPFCYSCYCRALSGRCELCHSDDCMRELAGEGVDWGVSWVLPILLREALTPVNTTECFEESIRECYPETTMIGWMECDTVTAMKDLDPVSFEMAAGEWVDQEVSDDRLMTFDNGNSYYWTHDIEAYLDEQEGEQEETA
jgi:hypothetical protein